MHNLIKLFAIITVSLSYSALAVELFNNKLFNSKNLEIKSKHSVAMRTRYHTLHSDKLNDATALTTALRLNSTITFDKDEQWSVNFTPNIVHAFIDDYNSVTVAKDTVPIPDPESFDIIQGNVQFDALNGINIKVGRQNLRFDNERMIGTVNFWQKPQSFDAIKIQYNNSENINLQYIYSTKVHRFYGHKAKTTLSKNDNRYTLNVQRPPYELGEHQLNSHLFNLHYQTENNINIIGYHYNIDNKDHALWSTQTTGLRIHSELKPARIKYRYTFEHAQQQDTANNPNSYHAWYNFIELGAQYKSHRIDLAQEVLSQDGQQGFLHSLGSAPNFQGWANAINTYGIRDNKVSYKGRLKKLRWHMVYHRFNAYLGGQHIANEFDIEVAYRLKKWDFKMSYADYQAKEGLSHFPPANVSRQSYFITVSYNM